MRSNRVIYSGLKEMFLISWRETKDFAKTIVFVFAIKVNKNRFTFFPLNNKLNNVFEWVTSVLNKTRIIFLKTANVNYLALGVYLCSMLWLVFIQPLWDYVAKFYLWTTSFHSKIPCWVHKNLSLWRDILSKYNGV